jgi:hypothetical protein
VLIAWSPVNGLTNYKARRRFLGNGVACSKSTLRAPRLQWACQEIPHRYMHLCPKCRDLQDRPANEHAHEKLRLIDPGPLTRDGWQETWQCDTCEAVWTRINTPLDDPRHRWTMKVKAHER